MVPKRLDGRVYFMSILQVNSRVSTKYRLLFVCLVRKSKLNKQRQETAKKVVRRGWTSSPQKGRTAQGPAYFTTQAYVNRSYDLFSTQSFQTDHVSVLISGLSERPCRENTFKEKSTSRITPNCRSPCLLSQRDNSGGKKQHGWRLIEARSILQKHDPVSVFVQSAVGLHCGRKWGMQDFVLDSSSRGPSFLLKNNIFHSLCAADNGDPGSMFRKAEHTRPRTQ